jgi:hypothetical protein
MDRRVSLVVRLVRLGIRLCETLKGFRWIDAATVTTESQLIYTHISKVLCEFPRYVLRQRWEERD